MDVYCSFLYFLWFLGNFIFIWFEEFNRYKNLDEVLVDYEIFYFFMDIIFVNFDVVKCCLNLKWIDCVMILVICLLFFFGLG